MITVQELIEILNTVEDKTLPVVLYTDHGQTLMKMTDYGIDRVENLEDFMLEKMYFEDEIDDVCHKVFVLEAP